MAPSPSLQPPAYGCTPLLARAGGLRPCQCMLSSSTHLTSKTTGSSSLISKLSCFPLRSPGLLSTCPQAAASEAVACRCARHFCPRRAHPDDSSSPEALPGAHHPGRVHPPRHQQQGSRGRGSAPQPRGRRVHHGHTRLVLLRSCQCSGKHLLMQRVSGLRFQDGRSSKAHTLARANTGLHVLRMSDEIAGASRQ